MLPAMCVSACVCVRLYLCVCICRPVRAKISSIVKPEGFALCIRTLG